MSSRAIYKYPLAPTDSQILCLPKGAKILSIITQNEAVCLYAEVNTAAVSGADDRYEIRIYGTGHQLRDDLDDFNFLGTVSLHGGLLVFHIFYKKV